VAINNDEALAGLIAALQDAGRGVPEDASVIGILGPTTVHVRMTIRGI
jgi:DNA-binding LacI/PurR family transcriptional regulator